MQDLVIINNINNSINDIDDSTNNIINDQILFVTNITKSQPAKSEHQGFCFSALGVTGMVTVHTLGHIL